MKPVRTKPRRPEVSLEQHRREISRCVRCGACKAVCPSFLTDRDETFSARGRMALIAAVLQGTLPVSGIYRDRLMTCIGCLACEEACPSAVPVTSIIQAAKEAALRESGPGVAGRAVAAALSSEALMRSLAWLAPAVLRYAGKSVTTRGRGAGVRGSGAGGAGTKGRVVFFPGCAIAHFQQDIAHAAAAVLHAAGYEMIVPEGAGCCGRPHLTLGDRAAAEEQAEQVTAALSGLKADAVVTACASCSLTFKREYPALLARSGQAPVPVLDIHEFLAAKTEKMDLVPLPLRVTWHDPCHLGRGQGLSGAARGLLRNTPGVELIEMDGSGACCGFGGVMRVSHAGLSDRIGDAKAASILATRATVVATGCPGCRMQIAESLRRAGSPAGVLHTVQVLARALRHGEGG